MENPVVWNMKLIDDAFTALVIHITAIDFLTALGYNIASERSDLNE